MALTPTNDSDRAARRSQAEQSVLMREVDEAVRKDQMDSAVRRYALPVGAAVLVILLALGGWLWWRSHQESAMEARSENLVTAFDELQGGSIDDAAEKLVPIAESGEGAAALSARIAQAGVALRQQKRNDAIAIFRGIADDGDAPKPYRDLAAVRLSAAEFESVQPQAIIDRLKPLAVPGNPWFGSAGELVAMAYLKQDKPELAGPLLAQIAKDEAVPATLRARTRQLAGLLGYDAVDDVNETLAAMRNGPGAGAAPAAR